MPGYTMQIRGTDSTPLPQALRLHLSADKSRILPVCGRQSVFKTNSQTKVCDYFIST